jgi:hypothetical protein
MALSLSPQYPAQPVESRSPRATDIPLDWQLRFTWECAKGITHPRYTYSKVESEGRAIDHGMLALERMGMNPSIRLVEVHCKHVDAERWDKVE